MSNETADTPVETVNEEANVGEQVDWEKRALRAEAKIVELKKSTKEVEAPKEEVVVEEEPKAKEEEKAEGGETDNQISELQKQIEELKRKQNQDTTNMMSVSGTPKTEDNSSYTISDLENMSQDEYNKAKDRIEKGEASVVEED